MIERMRKVCIVSSASSAEAMLKQLRKLGTVHLASKKPADPSVSQRFAELSSTMTALKEIEGCSYDRPVLDADAFELLDKAVRDAFSGKKALEAKISSMRMACDALRPWGDFDPASVEQLAKAGIGLSFYTIGKKELSLIPEDCKYLRLAPVNSMQAIAVIGELDNSVPAMRLAMPTLGLSQLESGMEKAEAGIRDFDRLLSDASQELSSYKAALVRCTDDVNMSVAANTVEADSDLVWITGYIPAPEEQNFRDAASQNGWAYMVDDVADDDEDVPTKVRYSKVSGLMQPVFQILGTVPGYREYDISMWFLMFFTLFFAMIIGDAGYGLCFLAVAIGLTIRQKKLTNLSLLVYVLSIATVAWGAVTGTWFGFEEAMDIPLLKSLVIPRIANYPQLFGIDATTQQNAVMKFCFQIGTVQLSLACVMNVVKKMREGHLGWIADIGWFFSINALYMLVMLLVIGEDVDLMGLVPFIAGGFLSVVLFGGMSKDRTLAQGLKAGLGDAFTTFLNTISAFGNVMSYIRLFAVGMASLAIAQSFNDMGKGLGIAGMAIIVLGHTLNLVMGLLSVVVHGVRLNLLEFSGQLGMEWSGTSYEPFKKTLGE